jgi:hypothetical protein
MLALAFRRPAHDGLRIGACKVAPLVSVVDGARRGGGEARQMVCELSEKAGPAPENGKVSVLTEDARVYRADCLMRRIRAVWDRRAREN